MSILGFGMKEKTKTSACVCNGNTIETEAENMNEGCCVKVLGSGCKSCHELYENVQKAVKSMGLSTTVEYVTDMKKVAGYGVMSMPALVVNEKVVSMGKVLKASEVEKLFQKL